jgi:hypothetical protein
LRQDSKTRKAELFAVGALLRRIYSDNVSVVFGFLKYIFLNANYHLIIFVLNYKKSKEQKLVIFF